MIAKLMDSRAKPQRVKRLRGTFGLIVKHFKGRRGFRIDQEALQRESHHDDRFVMFTTNTRLKNEQAYRMYLQKHEFEKVSR